MLHVARRSGLSAAMASLLMVGLLFGANYPVSVAPLDPDYSVAEAKDRKSKKNGRQANERRSTQHRHQVRDGKQSSGEVSSESAADHSLLVDEGPVLDYTPTDIVIYESTASISKGCSQDLCAEAGVKNGKFTVEVTPQLAMNDRLFLEYVAGRVKGETDAPKKRVKYMRLGGVLLRSNGDCQNIHEGEEMESGDDTFHDVKKAARYWTKYYEGTNDCWAQTGHNYFKIKTGPKKDWESFVFDDKIVDN